VGALSEFELKPFRALLESAFLAFCFFRAASRFSFLSLHSLPFLPSFHSTFLAVSFDFRYLIQEINIQKCCFSHTLEEELP